MAVPINNTFQFYLKYNDYTLNYSTETNYNHVEKYFLSRGEWPTYNAMLRHRFMCIRYIVWVTMTPAINRNIQAKMVPQKYIAKKRQKSEKELIVCVHFCYAER